MPEVDLYPTEDAYVDSGVPTTNFGSDDWLLIGEVPEVSPYPITLGVARTWMKFSLAPIPPGSVINSAILQMSNYMNFSDYNPHEIQAARSTDTSWTETGITWNNAPNKAVNGNDGNTLLIDEESSGIDIVITGMGSGVQKALSERVYSCQVRSVDEDGQGIGIRSRQYTAQQDKEPRLIVNYTEQKAPGLQGMGEQFASFHDGTIDPTMHKIETGISS